MPNSISVDRRCWELGDVENNVAVEKTTNGIQPERYFSDRLFQFPVSEPSDVIMPTA